ncbi:MAG: hypothetical protein D6781_12645 [Verrucomicrobia bacterium]|nr:MAG: hypothetical protein D6781_12645 [Verrucomicrobiota bacterium]
MDLETIINEAADNADDFLSEVSRTGEARPVIRQFLKERHPELSEEEIAAATARIIDVLAAEDFFDGEEHGETMTWRAGEDDSIHEI